MDVMVVLGIVSAAGTLGVQIFYGGKIVRSVEFLQQNQRDTDAILEAHSGKLENHGERIAILETVVKH